MANYNDTKMVIDAKIRRNGRQAITGDVLNSVLTKMLDELGKGGFKFGGVITPESSFTPGDANVAFLAATPGVYANFGGFTLEDGKLGVFTYDGSWHLDAISVGGGGSSAGAVRYDESQELSGAEKAQARANINAASSQSVSIETARAQAAEANLSNNILAEQTRAEGAESALSARIDTIIQGRNVRDIVGNYDELLAYDTSTLGDNDIVMVLLDATKSGHTTYYRWKEAEGEWEFIGGIAFTYTKTEIDDKFAALHIVLPAIPRQAVEIPEEYQELLAQVDSVVRGAGADASFKMPVSVVASITGNVDVTFVKSNPAHLYLGIFADDMSTLYHITRTTSTPRTYTLQIVEKVFATDTAVVHNTGDETIAGKKTFTGQTTLSQAIVRHRAMLQEGFNIENKDDYPNEDGVSVTFNKRTRPDESQADVVSLSGVGDSVILEGVETPMRSSDAANKGYVDSVAGKRGVLSQKQNWNASNTEYTISDEVMGIIPQSFIDEWIDATKAWYDPNGSPTVREIQEGSFNEQTGYFELHGLTDLTYHDARMILLYGRRLSINGFSYADVLGVRTIIIPCVGSMWSPSNAIGLFLSKDTEVLKCPIGWTAVGRWLLKKNSYDELNQQKKLHTIEYVMINGTHITDLPALRNCKIKISGNGVVLNLAKSPLLTIQSVKDMIELSYGSCTLTLHKDVYDAAMADEGVQAAMAAHTNITLASA